MRYGFCIGDDYNKIKIVHDIGGDYVETGFDMLARDPNNRYDDFAAELKKVGLACESANCFIPGDYKVTGDSIDYDKIKSYIHRGMERGAAIGLKTVVFGSGGARSVPDEYPFDAAFKQLVYFVKEIAAPIALKYGVNIVIEPLYDCNIINTAKEGVMLAAAADCKNVFGLVDLFHMVKMSDPISGIKDLKGVIAHAHIAEPAKRVYPVSADEYDYKSFIDALEAAGCSRCSVEAGTDNFAVDAPAVMQMLKNL